MFGENKIEEAKLYYLFMMSDGEVTYAEEKMFDSICNELRINKSEMEAVVYNCKQLAPQNKNILEIIKNEKIDEKAASAFWGLADKSKLARIVWNLVNLGYADAYYSAEEKEIVNCLINEWSVDKAIYAEMIDVADTMLALTRQKDWVMSSFPKGKERDEKEKVLDEEMSQLLDDIKLTIAELTM